MSLFEIKNVSKSFGDLKVLNDITVSVDKGEVDAPALRDYARDDGQRRAHL